MRVNVNVPLLFIGPSVKVAFCAEGICVVDAFTVVDCVGAYAGAFEDVTYTPPVKDSFNARGMVKLPEVNATGVLFNAAPVLALTTVNVDDAGYGNAVLIVSRGEVAFKKVIGDGENTGFISADVMMDLFVEDAWLFISSIDVMLFTVYLGNFVMTSPFTGAAVLTEVPLIRSVVMAFHALYEYVTNVLLLST